jgi:hypothetical protein
MIIYIYIYIYIGLFLSGFLTKSFYAFLSSPTRTTCSANLFVTPIYTLSSAHITQSAVTPSLSRPNISLSTLFSITVPWIWHTKSPTHSFYALFRNTPAAFPTHTYSPYWTAVQYHRCNTLNHTHWTPLRPDAVCHVQTTVLTLVPSKSSHSMKLRTCGVWTWTSLRQNNTASTKRTFHSLPCYMQWPSNNRNQWIWANVT